MLGVFVVVALVWFLNKNSHYYMVHTIPPISDEWFPVKHSLIVY